MCLHKQLNSLQETLQLLVATVVLTFGGLQFHHVEPTFNLITHVHYFSIYALESVKLLFNIILTNFQTHL